MSTLRMLTAGESHGPALTLIVDGLPCGLPIDVAALDRDLARRQQGYGRGGRQKIESDRAEVLSGLRFGVCMGSPVTIHLVNRDWANWTEAMRVAEPPSEPVAPITLPRPGHADLAGALKRNTGDIRPILERASARNTATLVAAGALAKQLLAHVGARVGGWVEGIGGVTWTAPDESARWADLAEDSPVRCPDAATSEAMCEAIRTCAHEGDTLGGVLRIVATGVPWGLGDYTQWDARLDGRLAAACMAIPTAKCVEIGEGRFAAAHPGSLVHDEIALAPDGAFTRPTNRAGGIEGGISNGQTIALRIFCKPLPTLRKPLGSVDLATRQPAPAFKERSDICAVPAAAVIAEAMVAWVLAQALVERFGNEHLDFLLEGVARWNGNRR